MSTARAPVFDVIVARMRCWWTPWPSWTSDALLSRIQGMSRLTASSTIAAVDGPNAVRSATPDELVERLVEVETLLVLDEIVDDAHREATGGEADLLVDVAVDDVVAARAGP